MARTACFYINCCLCPMNFCTSAAEAGCTNIRKSMTIMCLLRLSPSVCWVSHYCHPLCAFHKQWEVAVCNQVTKHYEDTDWADQAAALHALHAFVHLCLLLVKDECAHLKIFSHVALNRRASCKCTGRHSASCVVTSSPCEKMYSKYAC